MDVDLYPNIHMYAWFSVEKSGADQLQAVAKEA